VSGPIGDGTTVCRRFMPPILSEGDDRMRP
jgi:hypothetical protein